MKLFDAHCHLVDPDALKRAAAAGVEGIAICGTSPGDWADCLDAHRRFQGLENLPEIYPGIGMHPWFVSDHWKKHFQGLEKMVRAYAIGEKGAAMLSVGETGLDFQDRFTNRAEQEACFAAHLDLAAQLDRTVTVHCVKAWGRLIEILQAHSAPRVILHAFSGSVELIDQLVDLNCWFSFCGNVTNPNAKRVHAAAAAVPAERLLIETDAPDFPPAGCRAPNEPANLIHTARAVAELRGVEVEQIAELTFENAQKLFS